MSYVTRYCCRTSPTPPDPEVDPVFAVTFVTTSPGQEVSFAPIIREPGPSGNQPSVDWGDGTVEDTPASTTSVLLHTYAQPGTYQASYTGLFSLYGGSTQTAARMAALTSVDRWDVGSSGGLPIRLNFAFTYAVNLVSVVTPPAPVSSMMSTFRGATSFNDPTIADWDLSACTTLSRAFRDATSFTQDLSSWDTSALTDLSSTFQGATAFNGDLSGWDTSQVYILGNTFDGASSFNQPLPWDTTQVESMAYTFRNASVFNQPLPWDTSKVTTMSAMFQNAAAFNQDLSGWDVDQVTTRSDFNLGANPDWVANAAWQPQWIN